MKYSTRIKQMKSTFLEYIVISSFSSFLEREIGDTECESHDFFIFLFIFFG